MDSAVNLGWVGYVTYGSSSIIHHYLSHLAGKDLRDASFMTPIMTLGMTLHINTPQTTDNLVGRKYSVPTILYAAAFRL